MIVFAVGIAAAVAEAAAVAVLGVEVVVDVVLVAFVVDVVVAVVAAVVLTVAVDAVVVDDDYLGAELLYIDDSQQFQDENSGSLQDFANLETLVARSRCYPRQG